MAIYWLMFLLAGFGLILTGGGKTAPGKILWGMIGLYFVFLVGLRHDVGGDWSSYYAMYLQLQGVSFADALLYGDVGYSLLNWFSGIVGGDIYLVNLICALIFVSGVFYFSSRQPLPWVALVVSVPYLLIVVGMGYTRQSVALGFEFFALAALANARIRVFAALIVVGALFHKSLLLVLPVAFLSQSKSRVQMLFWLVLIAVGAYFLGVADRYSNLWENYVEGEMQSGGGGVRVVMNVIPAVVFLAFSRKIVRDDDGRLLWFWFSVLAIICIPFVQVASTAVDRLALYLIPLQLYVFSRLYRLSGLSAWRVVSVVLVFIYYSVVQFIWLHYSAYAAEWVPYESILRSVF